MKRVALVTGGGRGIGRAIVGRLARDGASVIIGDIDEEAATAAARDLEAAGHEARAMRLDVADEAAVASAYASIAQSFGRLDILVNNAGVLGLDGAERPRVASMSLGLWRKTIDVNLTGAFLMCRGAIPLLQRGGWGRIVNISSRVGRTRTGPGNAHYAASKAGLIGFSRVLAAELGAGGITVNCVAPSKVVTDMTTQVRDSARMFEAHVAETAVKRVGTADDVANAVAFLCSETSSFITGIVVDVTGGSFMP